MSESSPDTVVAGPGVRQGLWYTISEADGLPGGVRSLAQDAEGALWIGTSQGLFHYDGEIITRMFNSWWTSTVAVDDSGHVWFVSGNRMQNAGASPRVYDIHVARDGTVWVGTRKGVARWRDGRFESIDGLRDVSVFGIEEARDGALLFAHTGGVHRWRDADHGEDIATAWCGVRGSSLNVSL